MPNYLLFLRRSIGHVLTESNSITKTKVEFGGMFGPPGLISPPAPTRRLSGPVAVVWLHASPCVFAEGDVISPPGDGRATRWPGAAEPKRGAGIAESRSMRTGWQRASARSSEQRRFCASTGFTEARYGIS